MFRISIPDDKLGQKNHQQINVQQVNEHHKCRQWKAMTSYVNSYVYTQI